MAQIGRGTKQNSGSLWQNVIFLSEAYNSAGILANGDAKQMAQLARPVRVKRYAGQRLYCAAAGAYLTRDDLMTMARNGEPFVIIDAETQDDVTHAYSPIIIEH
jgi:hypothetical protein